MDEQRAYAGFASVYDLFMQEIPYEKWLGRILELLGEYGIHDGLALELGCGTGTFTELLAGAGFDMIGVDSSPEMLEEALEKKDASGRDILYLMQDMREFELYGTVRAVVSVCDSMNYILTEEDLLLVFQNVNNYLDPSGIFIFDLKTPYYYREIMGDCVLAENQEQGSFIWENYWFEEEQMNEYDLTLFLREPDGRYRKEEETHVQRAYELETIRKALEQAGMEFLAAYDAEDGNVPKEDSQRIHVVAREQGKERK